MASKPDTRSSGQKRGAPPLQESALTPSDPLPELQGPSWRGLPVRAARLGQGQGLPATLPTRVGRGFHRS